MDLKRFPFSKRGNSEEFTVDGRRKLTLTSSGPILFARAVFDYIQRNISTIDEALLCNLTKDSKGNSIIAGQSVCDSSALSWLKLPKKISFDTGSIPKDTVFMRKSNLSKGSFFSHEEEKEKLPVATDHLHLRNT